MRYSELSPARQALVRNCQSVNFGEIQSLCVRNGEPVFEHAPVVVIDVKLDQADVPRPELELTDFDVRDEVCRLMARLDNIGDGMIQRLEIRAGIPRRVVFEVNLPDNKVTI